MNGRELASELDVSETTVSRLLSGDRRPSVELMGKIRDWTGGMWTIDEQARALNDGKYGLTLAMLMRERGSTCTSRS